VSRLFLMDSSGANQRLLELETDIAGRNGAWSSDCSRIVFVSGDETTSQIFVVDTDGGNLQQLTDSAGHNEDPTWSPDGSQIAFWSDRAGDADIYLMSADGSSQVNLTNSPGTDESPAWVP
jgi:Tol biopolymer transport system component